MIVVLVSVVAVAALAVAVSQFRAAARLRTELGAVRREAAQASGALAAVIAERDAATHSARALSAENARAADELREARARSGELSLLLEAATGAGTGPDPDDEGLWRLLLAHVTRRWAAVVGVPPDRRALRAATPDDQFVEALARETERLREEVGVEVELTAARPATPSAGGVETTGVERVAVLVAALELLGALATTAQRVTVEVGDTVVLAGDGWLDPYREVAAACEWAAGAGIVLGPVAEGDEQVRIVVHHRPAVTAGARS
ncbi:MAG TPA: hypothetical protein VFR26_01080 [Acidimicrobiales bacterium]|nr:hypothetical protein [Acidimicrobiales bacterium]